MLPSSCGLPHESSRQLCGAGVIIPHLLSQMTSLKLRPCKWHPLTYVLCLTPQTQNHQINKIKASKGQTYKFIIGIWSILYILRSIEGFLKKWPILVSNHWKKRKYGSGFVNVIFAFVLFFLFLFSFIIIDIPQASIGTWQLDQALFRSVGFQNTSSTSNVL